MRKTSEEITREVFGQGARWIGWNHWLKYQVFFKFLEYRVERGIDVDSRASFYLKTKTDSSGDIEKMVKADIDSETGDLVSLEIPGLILSRSRLTVTGNSCIYDNGAGLKTHLTEMFDDPWRPTFEELDMFQMLYVDEQILIDMNREFFDVTRKLDKAEGSNTLPVFFPMKDK
ncbi:hypothetical protein P1A145kb_p179 [Pectobacterium phage DU_PP_I]|nr:hypothetical protein P1A145kb_p179 [Pectobacterium phage DU_PP_I]ATS93896.1 hypothetical protein P12B145kb_p180 [Pectobacterium phage DU_PP_IV]